MSEERSRSTGAVVSHAEQAQFVDAVSSGNLAPDANMVAYHFVGWLDKDVVDMVLEASTTPAQAVSALAGISPQTAVAAYAEVPAPTSEGPAFGNACKDAAAAGTPVDIEERGEIGNRRQTMTIEALQAHKASLVADPSCGDGVASVGKDDVCETEEVDNVCDGGAEELERVAAFIASYAGEQESAKTASTATKLRPAPFLVPRGTAMPATRQEQLVIATTAEKTVEVPGFEAFMKLQHGDDALFQFLGMEHALHSYYLLAKKHVHETVMKGGGAKGACAAVERQSPTPKAAEDPDVLDIMRMLGGIGR